jgi:chromosomal replication initiation ATPase DnaA
MVHFKQTAVNKVIALTAEQWGITVADLTGPRRTGTIAQARQASMAICYWNGFGKSKDIAAAHNRDNHATVLHACNAVDSDTRRNAAYKAKVMAITAQL